MSGGSTLFKKFDQRLEQEVRRRVNDRYKDLGILDNAPEVKVCKNFVQKSAVWFGGSMLVDKGDFERIVSTKAQYEEWGPSIARHNPVFTI